jgi:sodium transport system permease protein
VNAPLAEVWAVIAKEGVDGLRDRRSILSTLLFPLFGPFMILFTFQALADHQNAPRELVLPVVGAERAPTLVAHLAQEGIEIVEGPADPRAAVDDRRVDMVLVVPEEFPVRWRQGRPAPLELWADGARDDTRAAVKRVRRTIETWSQQIGMLRLVHRGVSPELANPVALEDVDVASSQQLAARVLGFVPMFVVLAAFIGGMNLAIDTTAGERERGSLEPLLVNPVPRRVLVTGKWVTAVAFSAVSIALTLLVCVLVLQQIPLQDLGLRFDLGPREIVGVLAASLPMAALAGGLQMLVATFARSFKEAQTYLSLLMFVPVLPGLVLTVVPLETQAWMSVVPLLGQQVLLMDVLAAQPPPLWMFFLAGLSALGVGYAAVVATGRLFCDERIVYGRS